MNVDRAQIIRSRKTPFAAGDIIIFAAAVILTVVLVLTVVRKPGSGVEIACEDFRIVLPLDKDCERRIADHLTVTVSGGKCRVSESDCRNRTCVKTGEIGRVGESIVCAQYGVVITVIGESRVAGSVGQS
ncbi:NusG domain II-containing protein [Pumilibacter intestinalis]|uniref:NusG domain II-containing protein n=1 Tax=Pumilibacter intestinalis TaxID=2941511 RepID=UPI00203A8482|nr:NusG domain II-containing protein [Pumilibacter intestinalis]MCI8487245.1 hypothetical protein [Clostridia bacterium]